MARTLQGLWLKPKTIFVCEDGEYWEIIQLRPKEEAGNRPVLLAVFESLEAFKMLTKNQKRRGRYALNAFIRLANKNKT